MEDTVYCLASKCSWNKQVETGAGTVCSKPCLSLIAIPPGNLVPGCRAAFHWDNAELEKSLMVRPLGDTELGGTCEWQWSGGFNLSTRYRMAMQKGFTDLVLMTQDCTHSLFSQTPFMTVLDSLYDCVCV